jgi:hypothetical protein
MELIYNEDDCKLQICNENDCWLQIVDNVLENDAQIVKGMALQFQDDSIVVIDPRSWKPTEIWGRFQKMCQLTSIRQRRQILPKAMSYSRINEVES